ncbi:MAG: transketolase, partial [Actinobacteria bacterium]|nr:transketolase [Actinomycetota bacterium]
MSGSPSSSSAEVSADLDARAIATTRILTMDAVQKAGNGHPGTAMALAPVAHHLFQQVLAHDPDDPHWIGRDRFILSLGHSSLTLYLQLFLCGYGLEMDDIKQLRQWGSLTPGHPEWQHTAGVETTTGPLGQGIGNGVGMALAGRHERYLLDPTAAHSIFDHRIW